MSALRRHGSNDPAHRRCPILRLSTSVRSAGLPATGYHLSAFQKAQQQQLNMLETGSKIEYGLEHTIGAGS